jgi:hypothetical protein
LDAAIQQETLLQSTAAQSRQPAFDRLLVVVVFILVFAMAARTPLDTDMWWHLSAGEEMLRSGRILMTDVFSFTRAGAAWTNPYWLFQGSMALIYRWQGFLGLSALVAGLAVISMALVCLQSQGPALLKTMGILLGSIVASVVWSPRPQLASLVLMALAGYLLYLYKWRGRDALWALPLVFVAWANVHGGYPLGLILIGTVVAGETLNHLLHIPSPAVLPWRKIARLVLWGAASGLAVLANPNGLRIWQLPFQTVEMRVLQQFIPEWASPDFHSLLTQSLLWLLLAAFAAVALSGRTVDGSDLLALLGFAFLALLAQRNFGPFALVAVPIFTRYGAAALEAWRARSPWIERFLARAGQARLEGRRAAGVKKAINLSIAALLWLAALGKLYVVSHPVLVESYLVSGYPARAAAWLAESRPGQRLLNEYNWGGFLHWSLRGTPVFVDGRTDLYNDEIVGQWITAVQAGPGWQEILGRYQVALVMLEPGRPLLAELPGAGWRLLYQDDQAVIYGRE